MITQISYSSCSVGSDIFIVGGQGLVKGKVLNSVDQFDVYAQQLTAGASLPVKRTGLQLIAFPAINSHGGKAVAKQQDSWCAFMPAHQQYYY